MSVLTGKELRVVGFLCNWCSYGGADTAGVARFNQPTDLRVIRVPCSGRVNPLFILKALINGADGVLVSGCHPRDCHYSEGNYYARRRLEALKELLPFLGIDSRRFEYTWVSASEGKRWQEVVTKFTEQVHGLGKAQAWKDVSPRYDLAHATKEPLRPLGCGTHPALGELKEEIKKALANPENQLSHVLGWQESYDGLHTTPLVMKKPEDVDKLVWGPLNVQNLATFLPDQTTRGRVGIVVKGCDSKSIVELLQEKLIKRENVMIFGMGCNGTVNIRNVEAKIGEHAKIEKVEGKGADLIVTANGAEHKFPMLEVAQDKCRACTFPSATLYDYFAGKPTVVEGKTPEQASVIDLILSLSLEERMSYWKGHLERCIRCYACRNACPMCVCREHCVADSRDPHWLTQDDDPTQKLFFQFIHALHLTGRCTGCGECNRACPLGIPVGALKIEVNRIVKKLFDYSAGMDETAVPPLLGFEVEEKHIHERHIGEA